MPDPPGIRSLLFVPGDRPEMIAKVGRSTPDGVVVDLEDAIPVAGKHTARRTAVDAVAALEVPVGTLVLIRVNAAGTPWLAADIAAVAGSRADGIVLPKAEDAGQLHEVRAALDGHGRQGAVLVAGLETARGVADARELLTVGAREAAVSAAYFGAEDYIADLGGQRTAGGSEVLYARSQVALAGRLAGVATLDQVVLAVHDEEGFRADATTARALGYGGKLCLHPAQVGWAHAVFTPSDEDVSRAQAVIGAMDEANGGVAVLDGEMVDEVHLRMARATLARARR